MNSDLQWETSTSSAAQTEELAEIVGRHLQGGEVIELVSDLGGGKTTFVRGLARGFGSPDRVTSPTFTISKVYKDQKRELHHFDFYRLQEAGVVSHELAEVVDDPDCTVVVEWGEVVEDVMPPTRLKITIKTLAESKRELIFSYPEALGYLVEAAK